MNGRIAKKCRQIARKEKREYSKALRKEIKEMSFLERVEFAWWVLFAKK